MRYLKSLFGVLFLSTLLVAPVKADSPWVELFADVYTGGSNFETTASIALSYQWQSTGVYLFQLDVTNLGTNGELLKSVGLFNVDVPPLSVTGVSAPTGWAYETSQNLQGDGLTGTTFQYNAPSPVPQGNTYYGFAGSFQFQVTGFSSGYPVESANIGAGLHSIGFNGCSTKLGVLDGSVVREGPYDPNCSSSVVPEPSTVILLGTGLAGLFGVAARRRREDEISEE